MTDAGRYLSSASEVAAHLGPAAEPGADPARLRWTRRTPASPPAEIEWDESQRLVRITAPLAVDLRHLERHALALAIAQVNVSLEILGLELDSELVFVSHMFFDGDGRVSTTVFDAILAAAEVCDSRIVAALERVRREAGG